MTKKSKSAEDFISALIIALLLTFAAGHISRLLTLTPMPAEPVKELIAHFKSQPFDFLYFHPIVFIYAFGIWVIGVITIVCNRPVPKGEMKGFEKGSNEFITDKELKKFIKNNTSEMH